LKSTPSSLAVQWNPIADVDGVPVLGYLLYIDDGLNGDFSLVYDGSFDSHTLNYSAVGLVTGLPYRFKLIAKNINGYSVESDVTTLFACLRPSDLGTPEKIATTKTSITIKFKEPLSNGCPLTGFDIFRDNGVNDDLTVSVDPNIVNNKPSLREYEIGDLLLTGSIYRIKVRAHNFAGSTDSNVLSVTLADEPDKPASGPVSGAAVTDEH